MRLRFFALVLWAVGVQAHEALGTAGLAALALTYVPAIQALNASALRRWWPVLGFVGWALVAPVLTGALPSGAGFARLLDWLTIPLVATAASSLSVRHWRVLGLAAFVTLAVSCTLAALQHFGLWPAEAAFASLGWTKIAFGRVYEPIGDSNRFMAGGLLFHRLKFTHVSGLVMVALTVALQRAPKQVGLWALAAFAFVALWLFPAARMGAVAMTVAVGCTVILGARRRGRALLLAGVLGVVGVVGVSSFAPLRARFVSAFSDQGSGQRTQHLAAGLAAIRSSPLVGIGAGQFRPSKFGGPDMPEHVRDNPGKAHNQFVSMAAESGVPGALIFIAMLAWLGMQARRAPVGLLTIGGLVHFAVLSLAHDPLFQAPYSMGLVLLLGLGLSAPREDGPVPTAR